MGNLLATAFCRPLWTDNLLAKRQRSAYDGTSIQKDLPSTARRRRTPYRNELRRSRRRRAGWRTTCGDRDVTASRGVGHQHQVTGFEAAARAIADLHWRLRFGLSYRDVQELLAERGVEADHVTIYQWVQRLCPSVTSYMVASRWQVGSGIAGVCRVGIRVISPVGCFGDLGDAIEERGAR